MAAVRGLNEKAKAFVLRHSEQAPSAFILNTNEFTKLQRYLYASKALPLSGSAFEDLFPDHCFKADVQLYHVANLTLDAENERDPPAHQQPMRFFPGRAYGHHRWLDRQLRQGHSAPNGEVTFLSPNPRRRECLEAIGKFRGETSLDKYELEHIVKRLGGGVLPPKEERESKMDEVMGEAKALVSTNSSTLDEEIAKACEEGKIKWYQYFPVAGTVLLVVDIDKHNGLFKALRMLNDRYEEEKRKGNFFKETTVLALASAYRGEAFITCIPLIVNFGANHDGLSDQISMLSDEQKTIESTMSNINSAVKKMQETFYELKISFENIKRNLDSVDTEMNEEDVHEKICAIDDLAEAMETWKDVCVLATVFQRTGLVLHVSEAPREITGEWL
ncbi:hypothetical protein NPX13_g2993 [Xylaria arbuscula]|uniref:Uncharacterized protein n=1 Tax=Xylaria arbuscula TaxID=114810 RepID=A0A9W8TPT1_9PEZI|nr:hypothetical protein NPX13_g2993 [Xylaria arbuscula]